MTRYRASNQLYRLRHLSRGQLPIQTYTMYFQIRYLYFMLKYLLNSSHNIYFAVVGLFKENIQLQAAKLLLLTNLHYYYIIMLKYFIEEEQPQAQEQTLKIIKTHFIKKKKYRPFHLDCQFTCKKICYCASHPIASLSQQSKIELWSSYQQAYNFYKKKEEQKLNKAKQIFSHTASKIRSLSREELAEFVRNFRSEKNLHIGENGEYENL